MQGRQRFIHLDKVELDIEIWPGAYRGARQLYVKTPLNVMTATHACTCFTMA